MNYELRNYEIMNQCRLVKGKYPLPSVSAPLPSALADGESLNH